MLGLDDAELSALDGLWTTSDGEQINGPAVQGLEAPSRPEAPEETGGLEITPGPGIFPWRSADPEEIAGQWEALREFTEWVVRVYRFEDSQHRGCWWQHPEIVQEWVALRHLYDHSWDREDDGTGPNNWHYWLEAARTRLGNAWGRHAGCRQRHTPPEPKQIHATVITDDQWQELTGTPGAYERPDQWPWHGTFTQQADVKEQA